MDNFKLDVSGDKDDQLEHALKIAFARHPQVTHYKEVRFKHRTRYYSNDLKIKGITSNVENDRGLSVHHCNDMVEDPSGHLTLVLFWWEDHRANKMLYPLDCKGTLEFVRGWLAKNGDPGPEPDIDGDLGAGWRIFADDWGHVQGFDSSLFGVQKIWSMYGK